MFATGRFFYTRSRRNHHIIEPSALPTPNVVVGLGLGIKAGLPHPGVQAPHMAGFRQHIQVSVNRSQTYIRQFTTDHIEELIGRGMVPQPLQGMENHRALLGHPLNGKIHTEFLNENDY